jgi:hypothetical protein
MIQFLPEIRVIPEEEAKFLRLLIVEFPVDPVDKP